MYKRITFQALSRTYILRVEGIFAPNIGFLKAILKRMRLIVKSLILKDSQKAITVAWECDTGCWHYAHQPKTICYEIVMGDTFYRC